MLESRGGVDVVVQLRERLVVIARWRRLVAGVFVECRRVARQDLVEDREVTSDISSMSELDASAAATQV